MKEKIKNLMLIILSHKFFYILPDKIYLKIKYRIRMGKMLNLKNPQTFNEKLQWLKLNDRKDIYTNMVDKYEAKKYVSEILGEEYIIPTIGVYDSFEEIDFQKLPNSFVIKCTHDSGGVIVCKDKNTFNMEKAKKKINRCLKNNYYFLSREWPYKNVKPRIIIEEYIGENLTDYRFYCFDGKPKYIYVYTNESHADGAKPEPACCDIFDINWKNAGFRQKCPPSNKKIDRPENFSKMFEISEILSKNTKFLRVDFYEVDGKLYNGELTLFPGGGMSQFYPNYKDEELGNLIDLKREGINEK